jgi:hypothetical protein
MPRVAFKSGTKIFLMVFIVGFIFASITQRGWEDYWITFRASRNLATGHGLVFTVGERLHTFTSPLGVLIPAALSWLTGNGSEELILWLFRLVSLAMLAGGVATLYSVLEHLGLRKVTIFFTLALVTLDSKTIDFSTNGMETGIWIYFLALTLHGMLVPGARQLWRAGLGWAGLMWTRPDSCIYIAGLAAGALLFLREQAADAPRLKAWSKAWSKLFWAGVICVLVYLPWFVWAWWYYGTPVPNTIAAKGTNMAPLSLATLGENAVLLPFQCLLNLGTSIWWTMMPAYARADTWPALPTEVAMVAAWVAALAWLCPLCRPQARMMSFCVYMVHFFLTDVVRHFYPWYLPAVACLSWLTLGILFDQLLGFSEQLPQLGWDRGWLRQARPALFAAAAGVLVSQVVLTVNVARCAQVQQRMIEDSVRRPIGIWLHDHASSPQDTVMLEPLGYIGYYSGLKMYDYPGLCSKEMVAVRKKLGPQHEREAYLELKPDWLVLRPYEAAGMSFIDTTHLTEYYDLVAVFDVSDQVSALKWPAPANLISDAKFLIFHRKPAEKAR